MAVGPFLTCEAGLRALLRGDENFLSGDVAAVLVTTTHTPNRATDVDYEDIAANECQDGDYSAQALASKAIEISGTDVQIDHGKVTFTAEGDITARYLYIVLGAAADLQNGDLILGYIDLTGSGNASSTNGEFSFDPHSSGLVYFPRSAAA